MCFVDYDFPTSCDSNAWTIVALVRDAWSSATGVASTFACTSFDFDVIYGCSVVLGVETRLLPFFNVSYYKNGPAYNASHGIGALTTIDTRSNAYDGWVFLKPFSWQVWLVFLGCVVLGCASQLFMRHLAHRRLKTSPERAIDKDTVMDVATTSFTSIIGASRMYESYDAPCARQAASMIMALFSFFFVALYSSNLIAFSFPERTDMTATTLTGSFDVHWAFTDVIKRDFVASFTTSNSSVRSAMTFSSDGIPIVPDTWSASYCSSGRDASGSSSGRDASGSSSGRDASVYIVPASPYKAVYEIVYARTVPDTVSSMISYRVVEKLSSLPAWTLPSSCVLASETSQLQLDSMWGLFAIATVGFVMTIAYRMICIGRDRPLFGDKGLRVFSVKTPSLGTETVFPTATLSRLPPGLPGPPGSSGDDSTNDPRRRESIDMFRMFDDVR